MQAFTDGLKEKIAGFSVAAALAGRPEELQTEGVSLARFNVAPKEGGALAPQVKAQAGADYVDPGVSAAPIEALMSENVFNKACDAGPEAFFHPFNPGICNLRSEGKCYSGWGVGIGVAEQKGFSVGLNDTFVNASGVSGSDDNAVLIRKGLDGNEFTRVELPDQPLFKRTKGHDGGPT